MGCEPFVFLHIDLFLLEENEHKENSAKQSQLDTMIALQSVVVGATSILLSFYITQTSNAFTTDIAFTQFCRQGTLFLRTHVRDDRTQLSVFGEVDDASDEIQSGAQDNGIETSEHTTDPSTLHRADTMKMSEKIMKAAAELTKSTSLLLGVKSIGVDYGLVRTGIAVSNGYNPQPLSIVSNLNNTQLSTQIIKLVESEKAQQVVMGLPFHKNGTEAEQTIITRNYASQLNCALGAHFGIEKVPIYLWDERYTSKEAESRIRAQNPRAGNLSKELDADAASIILEYYYGDNGLGAERVKLPDNPEIIDAIEKAWRIRKEEKRKELEALREQRMNAGNVKKELMEKARLLDEKLAEHRGDTPLTKKGKKKKKKKRTWINLTPNVENLNE